MYLSFCGEGSGGSTGVALRKTRLWHWKEEKTWEGTRMTRGTGGIHTHQALTMARLSGNREGPPSKGNCGLLENRLAVCTPSQAEKMLPS